LEVVAQVKLGSRAAGQTKRGKRQQNGAHYFDSRRKTSNTPTKAMTAAAIAAN
jgi:hypothetical protein